MAQITCPPDLSLKREKVCVIPTGPLEIHDDTRVAVIGAGSWGTALAAMLADKLQTVTLWCREPAVAHGIAEYRRNPSFVSDFLLPHNLQAETDLAWVAATHEVLVMVVPTQFTRSILQQLRSHCCTGSIFVSASKGIEVEGLKLLSQIYVEEFGEDIRQRSCYLSGPSFARDGLKRLPMAVAIAGENERLVGQVQKLFYLPYFRTYRSRDVVGVELGGALKNVIALAAGISDGLGFGASARAALITRGLAEMVRLGVQLGGQAETFAGLSGLGDLMLTSTSDLSRNRTVGVRLGSGVPLEEIQRNAREVAEGVKTAHGVHHLAQQLGVDMPITAAVYGILYEGRDPKLAVVELMERALKAENG